MKLAHWGPYALVESLSFDGILVETWNGPWAVCAAEETPPWAQIGAFGSAVVLISKRSELTCV